MDSPSFRKLAEHGRIGHVPPRTAGGGVAGGVLLEGGPSGGAPSSGDGSAEFDGCRDILQKNSHLPWTG